jgi:hypothetical protein
MNNEPSVPATQENMQTAVDCPRHHFICWEAVLAGTVTAFGIHLLLITLGAGAGLAAFSHQSDTNPVASIGAGVAIAWSLFVIIALSCGGWVAGRCSGCRQSGCLHGTLAWSLALTIALGLFCASAGLKAIITHHESWVMNGKTTAPGESDWAKAGTERSRDQLSSFTEEAVQSIPTNAAPKAGTRAQREVGFAVTKLFAPGNASAFPANRLEAINVLMVYTEMSAADATTTIDAWTISFKNLQAELDKVKMEMRTLAAVAEQKAKAAADTAADQRAHKFASAARWSFFALLVGLLGASLGGWCGAKCALRHRHLH